MSGGLELMLYFFAGIAGIILAFIICYNLFIKGSSNTSNKSTAQQNNKKTKTPDLNVKSTAQLNK